MIGQTISRYQILGELAQGGMGTVYRAIDPRFGREVALKVLPSHVLHDPMLRQRFEREAKMIASLEHSAIVPVYDVGEYNGQPFLVMRLMSGGSLTERLKNGPLPLTEAARITRHLAPALDQAHAQGIIHRDLKPSNILFDQHNMPYITDFGIAKQSQATRNLTLKGTIMGTPEYMSPEQARGELNLSGHSDIYALGAILFEMLTGHIPYQADTPMGTALRHVTDPVPRLQDYQAAAHLPNGSQAIIDRAMAKLPQARYPTAAALSAELTALANHKAMLSGSPTINLSTSPHNAPAEPPPKQGFSGRFALLGVGVFAVLCGLFLLFAFIIFRPTDNPTVVDNPDATTTPQPVPSETVLATPSAVVNTPLPSTSEVSTYLEQGDEYFEQEEYQQAIDEYSAAIGIDADSSLAYYKRGVAYEQKEDYSQAIADQDQAIKLDPDFAEAYYRRGRAYLYGKNDHQQAITDLSDAIRLDPDDAYAYSDRAWAYEQNEDHDNARPDYQKVIELADDDSELVTWAQQRLDVVDGAGSTAPSDTYLVATTGSATTFDPAASYYVFDWWLFQNVYEPLVVLDRENPAEVVHQLARNVEISDDGQTYTFTIRDGIRFHEGGQLSAEDVAYTFHRILLQGGGAVALLSEPIIGVGIHNPIQTIQPNGPELVNDPDALRNANPRELAKLCEQVKQGIQANGNTVTMKLAQPWAPFLVTLAGGWGSIMDKEWVIQNGGWDGDCTTWQNFVGIPDEDNPFTNLMNGTGPYKLAEGEPGQTEIVLVANETYWRDEETGPAWPDGPIGMPAIGRVVLRNVTDENTRITMLESGESDSAFVSLDNLEQILPLIGELCRHNFDTSDFDCEPVEDNSTAALRLYVYFDTSRTDALFIFDINDEGGNPFIGSGRLDGEGIPTDFFSDIHVRRAFNYCFDWERYIDDNGGIGEQNVGPIIPGMIGYNPDGPKYSFDLDQCAEELEQAWDAQVAENGFHMKLFNDGWSFARNLRDNLAQVDERYVIEIVDRQQLPASFSYYEEARQGRLPIALRSWKEDIHDPHNWVFQFLVGPDHAGTQRFPLQWVQEEFGPLINKGAEETDPSERQAIYEELTQLDYDKAIAIRLVVEAGLRYEQRGVQGWYYNPAYSGFYYYALQK